MSMSTILRTNGDARVAFVYRCNVNFPKLF